MLKDNTAKQIIFPLLSNTNHTFYQFRTNVFIPFLQMASDSVKDTLHSLKTETILVCGDVCYYPNQPDSVFFKMHLGKEKKYIYVVGLNSTLYELPAKYQLAGALGFTFKLCDDMSVKLNVDSEGKEIMARDVVW